MLEIVGVDAGGTWVKAARFRADLRELKRVKVESGASRGKQAYVDSIVQAVKELGGEVRAVGLSLPGLFNKERTKVEYSPNVAGLEVGGPGLSLLDDIAPGLGMDSVVGDNDAGSAALGEWALGEAQADPKKYLLHLTWGTGIGVGLIIEGVSQHGCEAGHLPFRFDSKLQLWSLVPGADLEKQIAVPALVTQLRQGFAGRGKTQTRFTEEDLQDERQVPVLLSKYAAEGDELAGRIVTEALGGMAWALHTMSIMAYPDLVTIGGAMMDSDWLLDELRVQVANQAQGILSDSLKPEMVRRARLGNDAGMIGAAMLARQKYLS